MHTCHAECPCHNGGQPVPDFVEAEGFTPGSAGCKCGRLCEWPCWQRAGLTAEPCCKTCAPLPAVDDEDQA